MKIFSLFQQSDKTRWQFIRYAFVGGFAFLVDFGLLFILTDYIKIHYLLSAVLSFLAALTVNYFLSKKWVFHKSSVKKRSVEFIIFGLIGIIGLGFNTLFIWIFTEVCMFHYMLSKILTTFFVYLWNFFARKYLLFSPKEE